MARDSILYVKCRRFATRIVKLHSYLLRDRGETVIANQIVRSGTSIGANVSEAIYASSRRDFLNKMTIAFKECSETIYWLDILDDNGFLDADGTRSIKTDCREIIKILVSTTKKLKEPSNPYELRETIEDFDNPLGEEDSQ